MKTVITLALAAGLTACGGGSGSGDITGEADGPVVRDDVSSGALRNVNAGATGKLFMANKGEYLDLDSGEVVSLSDHKIIPRSDGAEYLEIIDDFSETVDICGDTVDVTRVNIRDMASKQLVGSFDVPQNLFGEVLLSPDGQTIAHRSRHYGDCGFGVPQLWHFRDRQGELKLTATSRVRSVDYLNDGRLVALLGDDVTPQIAREIAPGTLKFVTQVPLSPSRFEGTPGYIDVSPDGQHAVFELITHTPVAISSVRYRNATVWQADLNTDVVTMLATTSRQGSFSDPQINKPIYSPDGQTVLLTEDYVAGAAVNYYGTVSEAGTVVTDVSVFPVVADELTYLISASADTVLLPPPSYSVEGARPLLSVTARGESRPIRINPFQNLFWLAE